MGGGDARGGNGGGGGVAGGAPTGAAGNLGTSGGGGASGSSGAAGGGAPGAGGAGTTGAAGRGGNGGGGSLGQGGSVAGASGGAPAGAAGSGGTAGSTGMGSTRFAADRVIVTGVRGTAAPAAEAVIQLHNGGSTSVQITSLTLGGSDQALFRVASPSTLPATVVPGGDVPITIRLVTTGAALPTAPANKDTGCNLLTATLTAASGAGSAQAAVYGLLLIQANWEPTLGQILTALGHKLNVGRAQNNWNPNTSMDALNLPGVEAGTDEVSAPHFVKAASGPVTITVVARFSPYGVLPYGWYPASGSTRNMVGTMAMTTDPQTNNKSRMVFPPVAANSSTTFDPGTAPFGLWVYSDQATQMYETGGRAANGDYDFSADARNTPANVHRFKTYPLKDAAGTLLAAQYLVAVEEAGNGDYQDFVFVLGNVAPAP